LRCNNSYFRLDDLLDHLHLIPLIDLIDIHVFHLDLIDLPCRCLLRRSSHWSKFLLFPVNFPYERSAHRLLPS